MELSLLVNCAAQLACEGAGPDEHPELWCCSVLNLMRHSATPVTIATSEGSPSSRKNPLRAIFEMRARLDDDATSDDQPASPQDKSQSSGASTPSSKSEPRSSAPFLLSQVCMPMRSTTLLHSVVGDKVSQMVEVDTPPIKGKAAPAYLGFPERASSASRRRKQASPVASCSDKSSSSPCSKRKKFACGFPGCGKTFGQTNHLQAHRRLHTGERPFVCTHPGCDKAFTQTGHLTAHLRIHTGERPYACSFPGCHKRFTQSTNMRMHLRVHGGCEEVDDSAEGQVPCRFHGCSRRFASRRGMETHVRSVHMAMLKSASTPSLGLTRELRPKSTRGSKRRRVDSSEDSFDEDSFDEDAYSDE